jgi:ClpP class serine protease
MTPEEFAAKLEELRAVFADKLVELEENPKWAGEDTREELVKALDELSDQIEDLMEALQTETDDDDDEGADED